MKNKKIEKPRKREAETIFGPDLSPKDHDKYVEAEKVYATGFNDALEKANAYHKQDIEENYVRKDSVLGRSEIEDVVIGCLNDKQEYRPEYIFNEDHRGAVYLSRTTKTKLSEVVTSALLQKGNLLKGMSVEEAFKKVLLKLNAMANQRFKWKRNAKEDGEGWLAISKISRTALEELKKREEIEDV